jgi:4-hydroxy-tetrahydrodipicolinate synthase
MVSRLNGGDRAGAASLHEALAPLFDLVTVKTRETTPWGEVVCRARNPLAIKTLMTILGMPSGGCRRPLGRMTARGLEVVLAAARQVQARHPEIFAPVAEFFRVDIAARLADPASWRGLAYADY